MFLIHWCLAICVAYFDFDFDRSLHQITHDLVKDIGTNLDDAWRVARRACRIGIDFRRRSVEGASALPLGAEHVDRLFKVLRARQGIGSVTRVGMVRLVLLAVVTPE